MQWIDEMFVNMEKDRTAESATRSERAANPHRPELLKKQSPGTLTAWTALVSSITRDVNEFNNHKERAGHTPVRVSQRHLQCEVHLPGMDGKSLVLTLNNKDLHVSVHPEFPNQPLTIAIELDKDDQHGFWILGAATKDSAKELSDQQLSEYLLKPVLSCAAIN